MNCEKDVSDDAEETRQAEMAYQKMAKENKPLLHYTFEGLKNGFLADITGHGFDAAPIGNVKFMSDGPGAGYIHLDGASYLIVARPRMIRAASFTVTVRVRPEKIEGRWGLVSKRLRGTECPFVLGIQNGSVCFEATDLQHKWSWNTVSPPVIKVNQWQRITAVVTSSKDVVLYVDGQEVNRHPNSGQVELNDEPLTIGHEAWGGLDLSRSDLPAMFYGDIADVQIWARPFTEDEVKKIK